QARRIFVLSVHTIVRLVSQDEEFLKHIRSIPFTSANLLLSVKFPHVDIDHYIGRRIMAHDNISYYLRDPVTFKATKIYKESLQEARQILEAEKTNRLR